MPVVPSGSVLWGIDVASYQDGIDLTAMPSVDFVIVKASEGRGYRNPQLAVQVASAQAAGKAWGLYHFASSGNTVEQEVANYLAAVAQYRDFVPVLDFEPADRSRTDFAAEWLRQVEAALGVVPWIYMDQSTSLRAWPGVKGRNPLWLARYPLRPSTTLGQVPEDGWSAPGWGVIAWQYTADGRVPGWGGVLDLNVFYGDHAKWASHCARRTVTPPPSSDLPARTSVYGVDACGCQVVSLPMVEARLREAGGVRQDLSGLITQGAYSSGVSASAGTHSGGGVWDVAWSTVDTDAKVLAWRDSGVAMFPRTPDQGFPYHGHGVWLGCPHLSPSAAKQLDDYRAGLNALVTRLHDLSPRPDRLLTWEQALGEWEAPTHTPYPDRSALQEDDGMITYRETNGTIWASNGSGSTGLSPDEAAAVRKAKTGADLTADEVRQYQDVEARLARAPAASPGPAITADSLADALLRAGTVTIAKEERP